MPNFSKASEDNILVQVSWRTSSPRPKANAIRRAQLETFHRPFGPWHSESFAQRLCDNRDTLPLAAVAAAAEVAAVATAIAVTMLMAALPAGTDLVPLMPVLAALVLLNSFNFALFILGRSLIGQ